MGLRGEETVSHICWGTDRNTGAALHVQVVQTLEAVHGARSNTAVTGALLQQLALANDGGTDCLIARRIFGRVRNSRHQQHEAQSHPDHDDVWPEGEDGAAGKRRQAGGWMDPFTCSRRCT